MFKLKKALSLMLSAITLTTLCTSCGGKSKENKFKPLEDSEGWFACWGTASQKGTDSAIAASGDIKGNTIRQVIRASIGGDKIKLTFSNEFALTPLTIEAVSIAKVQSHGSPNIAADTATPVTFDGGKTSITVMPGETVTTDAVNFNFEALEEIAVSTLFGQYTGSTVTCHSSANIGTYLLQGDQTTKGNPSVAKWLSSWYYLVGAETYAPEGTRVCVAIGDSITDRAGATWNGYKAWTDQLDEKLKANEDLKDISLINMGIGGNTLCGLWDTGSIPTKDRFERDVLNIPGLRYCILFIGINDVGGSSKGTHTTVIDEYKTIIEKCHEKGIYVYACTLTPVKGSSFYSDIHEENRKLINEFIRSKDSGFDGVFDFDMAVRRDDDPEQMKDEYNSPWGDFLHLGDKGYEAMANEVYNKVLNLWK